MTQPKLTGIPRLYRAFFYSLAGLKAVWNSEEAFRLECICLCFFAPLGYWLGQSDIERILLIGSVFFILIIELCNSAVETVVDRIGPEHHELSGRAKDIISAAVLLAVFQAMFVWLLILL